VLAYCGLFCFTPVIFGPGNGPPSATNVVVVVVILVLVVAVFLVRISIP